MKSILFFFLLLASFQFAHAQFALGGGIAFTANTFDVGVQMKSQYRFGNNWRAEFSLDGYVTDSEYTFYGDANLNINYIFAQTETIQLHALVGGTIFYGSTKNLDFVQKGSAQGINTGVGLQYKAKENVTGYIDTIFTFTDYGNPGLANRFLFTLGALYLFGD